MSVIIPAKKPVSVWLSGAAPAGCSAGPGASPEPGWWKGHESHHLPPANTTGAGAHTHHNKTKGNVFISMIFKGCLNATGFFSRYRLFLLHWHFKFIRINNALPALLFY